MSGGSPSRTGTRNEPTAQCGCGDSGRAVTGGSGPASPREPLRDLDKILLEFAAEHVVHTMRPQQRGIERRIEPVCGKCRAGIEQRGRGR